MKTARKTLRLHRTGEPPSVWTEMKGWGRRRATTEKVAEAGLALATAVSLCYLGYRLHVGLQNYALFTY